MPTISVIIPAYNCEKYIAEAIASVQMQSVEDLEIVVVNDGSTDSTLSIVNSLACQDPRIKVVSRENSGRPSVARNLGIRESSGEFLCFLDGDDFFLPGKLEKELNLLRSQPSVGLVFHDVQEQCDEVPKKLTYLGRVDFLGIARDYLVELDRGLYLCMPNFYNFMSAYCAAILMSAPMVRRCCLESQAAFFPEDMIIGEDIDLWFRLALAYSFAYLDEPLSCYRRHKSNITKDTGTYLKGSIEVHEINRKRGLHLFTGKERMTYDHRLSTLHWHYAYYLYGKYDMKGARREILCSLRLNFTKKAFVTYFKTLLPVNFIKLCKGYSDSRSRKLVSSVD